MACKLFVSVIKHSRTLTNAVHLFFCRTFSSVFSSLSNFEFLKKRSVAFENNIQLFIVYCCKFHYRIRLFLLSAPRRIAPIVNFQRKNFGNLEQKLTNYYYYYYSRVYNALWYTIRLQVVCAWQYSINIIPVGRLWAQMRFERHDLLALL